MRVDRIFAGQAIAKVVQIGIENIRMNESNNSDFSFYLYKRISNGTGNSYADFMNSSVSYSRLA